MLTKTCSWDDVAFLDTSREPFRGGIWKKEVVVPKPESIPDEDAVDEAEASGEGMPNQIEALKTKEARTMSTPTLISSQDGAKARGGKKGSVKSLADIGVSSGLEKPIRPDPPRAKRSPSFPTTADPMFTANHVDGDYVRNDGDPLRKRDEASAMLKDLSSKPTTSSPSESPQGSPPQESSMPLALDDHNTSISANTSSESLRATRTTQRSSLAPTQRFHHSPGP